MGETNNLCHKIQGLFRYLNGKIQIESNKKVKIKHNKKLIINILNTENLGNLFYTEIYTLNGINFPFCKNLQTAINWSLRFLTEWKAFFARCRCRYGSTSSPTIAQTPATGEKLL
jgi:hypothetical protein